MEEKAILPVTLSALSHWSLWSPSSSQAVFLSRPVCPSWVQCHSISPPACTPVLPNLLVDLLPFLPLPASFVLCSAPRNAKHLLSLSLHISFRLLFLFLHPLLISAFVTFLVMAPRPSVFFPVFLSHPIFTSSFLSLVSLANSIPFQWVPFKLTKNVKASSVRIYRFCYVFPEPRKVSIILKMVKI